ncbi:MAG: RidA family protein [Acidimicrobiia bacterium]|nr:RidA family protein [Acidimicrobiia bacterium]MYF82724.1 RidA family protein [Acidimicrobiia bacterium]
MERASVPSNRKWSEVGYSRAVRVGNIIEVAGTSSSGPGGQILHPGDMYGQSKRCMDIIVSAVEQLGGSVHDIVRTRVFLTDMSRWAEAGRAHGEAFANVEPKPASAFVGTSELLDPDLMVEIEATAILDG